ncbi:MAG TPA: ATP-binding cassette domain-containing protein, partial [Petrotogaceae bacterium]|nr:ATP-binding cassette domain-containing protein [Petrotogaceae bacterium]
DIYEIDRVEYKYRLKRIIADFQLEELMNIPVRKLSLGQRIRCEIAVSILHEPKILFLDEPTIGLDVVVKNQIRELIHDMNLKTGMTVFLTSHDVGDIEKLCKRILIIDKGKVILESTTYRLKHEFLKKKDSFAQA